MKTYFEITTICREDIEEHFRSKAQRNPAFEQLLSKVPTLTDSDMTQIAEKMANNYLEHMFWESLDIIVQEFLETKGDT